MSKPAIVFLEMVGQIIPCKTHGIICPTISQKRRTGYALPRMSKTGNMNIRMSTMKPK